MARRPGAVTTGAIYHLSDIRRGLPNKVTEADVKVANLLVGALKQRIPVDTGRLRDSVRVLGSGRRVGIGYKNVPYTLPVNADFGFISGAVRSVSPKAKRIFEKDVKAFLKKRNKKRRRGR